jgi:hypothetical protein
VVSELVSFEVMQARAAVTISRTCSWARGCRGRSVRPADGSIGGLGGRPLVRRWSMWTVKAVGASLFSGFGLAGWWVLSSRRGRNAGDANRLAGLAPRRDVLAAVGRKALMKNAMTLRPSLASPSAEDVGYQLGRSRSAGVFQHRGLNGAVGIASIQ